MEISRIPDFSCSGIDHDLLFRYWWMDHQIFLHLCCLRWFDTVTGQLFYILYHFQVFADRIHAAVSGFNCLGCIPWCGKGNRKIFTFHYAWTDPADPWHCNFSLTLSYTDANGTVRTGLQGLKVYLYPDFSSLTVKRFLGVLLDAMSQLFFSLSVSMGIMVTYGSYVKDDVNLNKSTNQIEIFDTGVAFLAGMMIIPAVFVFLGTDGMASGPSLIFISLPKVFASMGAIGRIIAIAFFLMMGFAALTSCVSVMETLVANCMEIFHKSRQKMCAVIGIYSLVTAVLICLGYNVLYFEVKLPNETVAQLLDVMDYISNSFLMPFISLLTSILIGWVVGPKLIIDEVERNGEHFRRAKLYCFMIRYAVPVVMLILFLVSTGIV